MILPEIPPSSITLLIAAIVIGIPLFLNWRAWLKDRVVVKELHRLQNQPMDLPDLINDCPRVSFLIPAWQEQKMIGRCLEAALRLPYPDLELVVCAGGKDDTYSAAYGFAGQRVIVLEQKPGEGKQHALQRCFEASSGEIIYLIDADCVIDEVIFLRCLAPMLSEDEQIVTGSFYYPLPEQLNSPFVVSQLTTEAYAGALINPTFSQPSYSQGLLGGNCAIRRLTLEQAGAFCPSVHSGTDYELALRLRNLGKKIRYQTGSVIKAEFPTGLKPYFRQQSRWIRNLVIHSKKGRDHNLVLAALRTSLIGVAMLAMPLVGFLAILIGDLARMVGYVLLILWGSSFAFMLIARVRYAAFTRGWLDTHIPIGFFILLPLYCLIDFMAWSTPFIEYTSFTTRQRW